MDCSFEDAFIYQAGYCIKSFLFMISFSCFSIKGRKIDSCCKLYFAAWDGYEIFLNGELKDENYFNWLCLFENVDSFERENNNYFLSGILANGMKMEVKFLCPRYTLEIDSDEEDGFTLDYGVFPDEENCDSFFVQMFNEGPKESELSVPGSSGERNHIPDVPHTSKEK